MKFCAFLLIWFSSVTAGDTFLSNARQLPSTTGFYESTVYSLAKDDDGFIWVGTPTSLFRYDGDEFKKFSLSTYVQGETLTNAGNIFIDSHNRLWIGTWGEGLAVYDTKLNLLQHFRNNPSDSSSLPNNMVQTIYEDKTGVIWVGTNGGGLAKYKKSSNSFKNFQFRANDKSSLSNNRVWSIVEDANGDLWVATSDGLNKLSKKQNTFTRFFKNDDNHDSLDHNLIRSLFIDKKNRLWIGTQTGLGIFNEQKNEFSLQKVGEQKNITINKIKEGNRGNILIATNSGVYNYDLNNDSYNTWEDGTFQLLSSNDVRDIYVDPDDILLIATRYSGIYQVNLKPQSFEHIEKYNIDDSVKNLGRIYSLFKDKDGVVWVGTNGGFLRYIPDRKAIKYFTLGTFLEENEIRAISEDQSNTLWIGGEFGLASLNKENMEVTFRNDIISDMATKKVSALLVDSVNRLWIGSAHDGLALHHMGGNTNYFRHEKERLETISDNTVRTIFEDSSNTIWIGTNSGGVNSYFPKTGGFVRHSNLENNHLARSGNTINSIYQTKEDSLWLATGKGVNLLNLNSGEVESFSINPEIDISEAKGIVGDSSGNLWISTTQGISKYDATSGTSTNFKSGSDFQNVFLPGKAILSRPKELIFGGVNGLNIINSSNIHSPEQFPKIVISALWANNELIPLNDSSQNHIKLGYETRTLEIAFSNPALNKHRKNLYSYMLEGLDNSWHAPTKHMIATYTNIPPGKYEFKVKGSNSLNNWNEQSVVLNLEVDSPPWKSWWAYSLYVLLVIGSLSLFVIYQRQKVYFERRLKLKLEVQVSERTIELNILNRIGQDINSNLNVQRIITQAYDYLKELVDVSMLGIATPNNMNGSMQWEFPETDKGNTATQTGVEKNTFLLAKSCLTRQETIIVQTASDLDMYLSNNGKNLDDNEIEPIVCIPLYVKNSEVSSCLVLKGYRTCAYSQEKLNIIQTIASYMAVAIDNANSYKTIGQKNANLIEALKLVDQSEQLAGAHSLEYLKKIVPLEVENISRGTVKHIGFFSIHLSDFNNVNQKYGFDAGKTLVKQTVQLIKKISDESTWIIRSADDELLVINYLPNMEMLQQLSERLSQAIALHTLDLGIGPTLHNSCSIGASVYPFYSNEKNKISWEQVIDIAKLAKIASKGGQSNSWLCLLAKENRKENLSHRLLIEDTQNSIDRRVLTYHTSMSRVDVVQAMKKAYKYKGSQVCASKVDSLTKRELQVLTLMAEGYSNAKIGEELCLALDTIKGYNRKIFHKLKVNKRVEAIFIAQQAGAENTE